MCVLHRRTPGSRGARKRGQAQPHQRAKAAIQAKNIFRFPGFVAAAKPPRRAPRRLCQKTALARAPMASFWAQTRRKGDGFCTFWITFGPVLVSFGQFASNGPTRAQTWLKPAHRWPGEIRQRSPVPRLPEPRVTIDGGALLPSATQLARTGMSLYKACTLMGNSLNTRRH